MWTYKTSEQFLPSFWWVDKVTLSFYAPFRIGFHFSHVVFCTCCFHVNGLCVLNCVFICCRVDLLLGRDLSVWWIWRIVKSGICNISISIMVIPHLLLFSNPWWRLPRGGGLCRWYMPCRACVGLIWSRKVIFPSVREAIPLREWIFSSLQLWEICFSSTHMYYFKKRRMSQKASVNENAMGRFAFWMTPIYHTKYVK